ncbi:polysaccharide biosynthesis/export family protein [Pelosinus sp. sgz500959]|uniref:polysaccharide biosynthesis/export family protein n=1 Tax=Pelosinus sp. sgz500959 TaxID=3242472 RepID=UPI0036702D1D
MKRLRTVLILAMLLVSMAIGVVNAEEYRLGPGDVLNVTVWGYEDLQVKELIVRPDGNIAFPLVGEVKAAGTSAGTLTENLTQGLSGYVKDPKVTVNVLKFHTTRVYVLGEVVKPGMYEIERDHNLLDAIGIAGGYTKNAAKKQVMILHKGKMDAPIKANLLNILQKGDMTQNYVLGEGDVVYLTDNGKINFATDILPWISATYQIVRIND